MIVAIALIVASQALFFLLAAARKTDKFTDISYGGTFALIAALTAITAPSPLTLLLSFLVFAWGARLGIFLLVRVIRLGKDARFDGIRESPRRFATFWLLQAITITIVSLPLLLVPSTSLAPFDFIGSIVWAVGFAIETIADAQKYRFKNAHPSRWVDVGLWKYARHPNYFGEILCWVGIFIIAAPHLSGWRWLAALSPVYITLLLLFVSGIPPLERAHAKRYGALPEYQKYVRRTSLLIPLPRAFFIGRK